MWICLVPGANRHTLSEEKLVGPIAQRLEQATHNHNVSFSGYVSVHQRPSLLTEVAVGLSVFIRVYRQNPQSVSDCSIRFTDAAGVIVRQSKPLSYTEYKILLYNFPVICDHFHGLTRMRLRRVTSA